MLVSGLTRGALGVGVGVGVVLVSLGVVLGVSLEVVLGVVLELLPLLEAVVDSDEELKEGWLKEDGVKEG